MSPIEKEKLEISQFTDLQLLRELRNVNMILSRAHAAKERLLLLSEESNNRIEKMQSLEEQGEKKTPALDHLKKVRTSTD